MTGSCMYEDVATSSTVASPRSCLLYEDVATSSTVASPRSCLLYEDVATSSTVASPRSCLLYDDVATSSTVASPRSCLLYEDVATSSTVASPRSCLLYEDVATSSTVASPRSCLLYAMRNCVSQVSFHSFTTDNLPVRLLLPHLPSSQCSSELFPNICTVYVQCCRLGVSLVPTFILNVMHFWTQPNSYTWHTIGQRNVCSHNSCL